jgi:hypothetical protein
MSYRHITPDDGDRSNFLNFFGNRKEKQVKSATSYRGSFTTSCRKFERLFQRWAKIRFSAARLPGKWSVGRLYVMRWSLMCFQHNWVDSGISLQANNSVAFSPQANYTDWSTATCWRNLVPTSADRGISRGQLGGSPKVVNLSFLDRSRYFSFK